MTTFARVAVTGGAGFIGSHLVDSLVARKLTAEVVVIDNLSSGRYENVEHHIGKPYFKFVYADLKSLERWPEALRGAELVIHMAANPEVRASVVDPATHFSENLLATFNVLEASRRADVKYILLASSSTVYGDAKVMPTPEDYHPLEPISIYGATKLCAEHLCATYSLLYSIKCLILRYANIVGRRSTHGVVIDFIAKLRCNPKRLEILGDGTQRKSYLHVSDAVDATLVLTTKVMPQLKNYDVYNVGNLDWVTVKEIADIVVEEMGLREVEYVYVPATRDGRGWPGDVKLMLLDVRKLLGVGWRPRLTSKDAIRKSVREALGKE